MLSNPVARRYAGALFGAAQARDLLDPVRGDLEAVAGLLRTNHEAGSLLRNSPLGTEERQGLVRRLFGGRVEPLVLELLLLLLEKKRFELLDDVTANFRDRHERERGILRVEVMSAVALAPAEEQRLRSALERRTGKRILLEETVLPELIGGLRVRIGDRVIERSVRRSLEAMRARMREAVEAEGHE